MAMISCHYKITSSRGQSSSTGKGKKYKCKKTNGLSPPLCLWTNDTGDDLQWNVNPIIIIITMCSSTSVASFGVRGLTFNTNSFLAHDVFLVSRDKSVDNSNCSVHVQPPTHDDVSERPLKSAILWNEFKYRITKSMHFGDNVKLKFVLNILLLNNATVISTMELYYTIHSILLSVEIVANHSCNWDTIESHDHLHRVGFVLGNLCILIEMWINWNTVRSRA